MCLSLREPASPTRPGSGASSTIAYDRLVRGVLGKERGTSGPARRPLPPPLEVWGGSDPPTRTLGPAAWGRCPADPARGRSGTQRPSTRGKNPAADLLQGRSRGGSACSKELTRTEFGFSNPKPKPRACPPPQMPGLPRPRPPIPPQAKGPASPARRGESAARGGRGCRTESRPRAGMEGREPGRASQEGGQRPGPGPPPQARIGPGAASGRCAGHQTGPEP